MDKHNKKALNNVRENTVKVTEADSKDTVELWPVT